MLDRSLNLRGLDVAEPGEVLNGVASSLMPVAGTPHTSRLVRDHDATGVGVDPVPIQSSAHEQRSVTPAWRSEWCYPGCHRCSALPDAIRSLVP